MQTKFGKESLEFRMFQEYWALLQNYGIVENTKEYWDALHADRLAFANKYGAYGGELVNALYEEMGRRAEVLSKEQEESPIQTPEEAKKEKPAEKPVTSNPKTSNWGAKPSSTTQPSPKTTPSQPSSSSGWGKKTESKEKVEEKEKTSQSSGWGKGNKTSGWGKER